MTKIEIPEVGQGDVGNFLQATAPRGGTQWAPAGGGTVGPGTPGTVAVFTGVNAVADNLPGTDVTFAVPAGQVGVFALNGVSLCTFGGAGFAPTVNHGVASGDAAHVWANVYGLNVVSDLDLGLLVDTGHVINLTVNAVPVLTIQEAPGVTWLWPAVDGGAGDVLTTDGAGGLSFAPAAGSGWTVVQLSATQTGTGAAPSPLPDLVAAVTAGQAIRFRFTLFYHTDATGNGIHFTVTGPAASIILNPCMGILQAGTWSLTKPAAGTFDQANTYAQFTDPTPNNYGFVIIDGLAIATANGSIGLSWDTSGSVSATTVLYQGSSLETAAI